MSNSRAPPGPSWCAPIDGRAALSRTLRALLTAFRAGDWWEYKLVPTVAIFYATALMLGASLASLGPALLILLLALIPGAIYVSVINDLTDRKDDLAAGKSNRLSGRSPLVVAALLGIPVGLGAFVMFLWRGDLLLLGIYAAAWLSFSVYSLPPLRLKSRGLAGVFADACGAHLCPSLLAAVLVFREAVQAVDPLWLSAVAVWALAYGLRGILRHQLGDLQNDRQAGVSTFAARHSPLTVVRLARFAVFPLEVAGLTVLLWHVGSVLPAIALVAYVAKMRYRNIRAAIVDVQPGRHMALQEYYDVFLPLALLIAASLHHSRDLAILAFHLLCFPKAPRAIAGYARAALRVIAARLIHKR